MVIYVGEKAMLGPGIILSKSGTKLCSSDVIHVYRHKELGMALNPTHADISSPRIWKCIGNVITDDGLKVGVKELKCIEEVDVPNIKAAALVRWAILMAKTVYTDPSCDVWMNSWLTGRDRSKKAAFSAQLLASSVVMKSPVRMNALAESAAWWAARAALWAAAKEATEITVLLKIPPVWPRSTTAEAAWSCAQTARVVNDVMSITGVFNTEAWTNMAQNLLLQAVEEES